MSNERMGIIEQRADDRVRYAKFFYRAPVIVAPGAADTSKLTARIIELERGNIEATNRLVDLEHENKRLRASLGASAPLKSIAKPREVAEVFCKIMAGVGYEIDGLPYSMDMLMASRRSQVVTRPRHVFMWVVRKACSGDSLTMLGRFMDRDHTSIMHGVHKATRIMAEDATLRGVALAVLATFGIQVPE